MYKRTLLTWIVFCLILPVRNVYATSSLVQKVLYPGDASSNWPARFGVSVRMSNNYCVIGASTDDSSGYYRGGAAYVYKYNSIDNKWSHMQTLHPNDVTTYARCGESLSIFDKYIVVGCYGIKKAYIYKYNQTNETWYQLSTLATPVAPVINETSSFASSVDITDGYAIVGDHFNDDQASYAGSSYIFVQKFDEFGDESFIYNQTIYASDAEEDDRFGISVSMSYDYAIVGARRDKAYIFALNANTMIWEQVTKLLASDGVSGDYFGWSVSIDGVYGLAIVGAYRKNDDVGASYIYTRNNYQDSSFWNQTAKLTPNNDMSEQRFGDTVSIYGETCIVGALETNFETGAAYEYKLKWNEMTNTTTWQNTSYFTPFDGQPGDEFGYSVDVFGGCVIIGAPEADSVYIYNNGSGYNGSSFSPTEVPTPAPTHLATESPSASPTASPTLLLKFLLICSILFKRC